MYQSGLLDKCWDHAASYAVIALNVTKKAPILDWEKIHRAHLVLRSMLKARQNGLAGKRTMEAKTLKVPLSLLVVYVIIYSVILIIQ